MYWDALAIHNLMLRRWQDKEAAQLATGVQSNDGFMQCLAVSARISVGIR